MANVRHIIIGILYCMCATAHAHHVCYDPYGCFSDEAPFDDALVRLPQDPKDVGTTFTLFTKRNPETGEELSPVDPGTVGATNFDGNKRTVMFTHGYLGKRDEFWVAQMVEAMLKREDMNVIFVDWSKGAKFPYHQAVGNSRLVGAQISLMVQVLSSTQPSLDLSKVHLVGFSLGAHSCGGAGKILRAANQTIGRITGLDPSAIYFENRHQDVRLDPTDAHFVDVIHTDIYTIAVKGFGAKQPLGHLDFYPNGGNFQSGCLSTEDGLAQVLSCSHYRAARYFIESINSLSCPFRSYPCNNYDDFAKGLCNKCPPRGCPSMGYDAISSRGLVNGSFYLQTVSTQPFCAFHYHIKFYTGSKIFADLNGAVKVVITGDKATSEVITIPKHYFRSGGTESFLIITKMDLGRLEKIKIQHDALIDNWLLYAAVVRPLWSDTIYTGCFKKWLNDPSNEVNLKTGIEANCP